MMSGFDRAAELVAGKLRLFQEPWITNDECVCAIYYAWDKMDRNGLTDEEVFLADPDAVLATLLWHPDRGEKHMADLKRRWGSEDKGGVTAPSDECPNCESSPCVCPELWCSVCGEAQFPTPSGLACGNGHGGAPSVHFCPRCRWFPCVCPDVPDLSCTYAIGPAEEGPEPYNGPQIGRYLFSPSTYSSGPFPTLAEALDVDAREGDALWRCRVDGKDEIIDLWSPGYDFGGVRYAAGWSAHVARTLAGARIMPGPKTPAPPPRNPPPRNPPPATTPVPPAAASAPAAPPHFQEGENLDDARREAGLSADSDRVFVAVGKTINVGDYESIRVDIGRTVNLRPGEDADQIESDLFMKVAGAVMQREQEIRDALGQA